MLFFIWTVLMGNRKNCYLLRIYYMTHAIPSTRCAILLNITIASEVGLIVTSTYKQGNVGKKSK